MSDSESDSFENTVWVIVIIVALALLLLACFKCWLDARRTRRNTGGDTEILDHSIEIHDGNDCLETLGTWLFSSCYTVEDDGRSDQQHELEGSPERTKELLRRAAATGVQQSTRHVSKHDIKNALIFLQRLQQNDTDTKEERVETIRLAQNVLMLQQSKPTESSLQTTLVIGVDARPRMMAGYCVNLKEKNLEYYAIKMDDFPWKIENRENSEEFEMKNLQFACMVWGKRIRRYKKFRIYTDNNAIENPNSEFGADADDLVGHFRNCEDVELVNEQVHVNRKQNLERFAKYIQPADDFSRWEIEKGIDFLCNFYGIEKKNVKGTHKLTRAAIAETKAWYDPNGVYQETLQRAQTFAKNLKCENCMFDFLGGLHPQPSQIRSRQMKSALRKKNKSGNSLRQVLHHAGQNNRGRGLKRY